ncbi:hypothetical protein BH23BAC4_BH23BAC4_06130 [soil metagenome]
MRYTASTPALALALFACETNDQPPTTPSPDNNQTSVCLEGRPFQADGTLSVEGAGEANATRVADLRWEAHEGCERFVVDLSTEATVPASGVNRVAAQVLRDLGVVRIHLPGIRNVAADATDMEANGELVREAFAIWAPDGDGTYIDIHLASAAEVHVHVLTDPARVVVDLRPGVSAIPSAPARSNAVAVLTPRAGAQSYPLRVTGYARTFEANVVARLEQDGEEVFSDFTTATAWADAWDYFEITIPEGPSGSVTLHVGEHSARDGTWQGAEIPLEMD